MQGNVTVCILTHRLLAARIMEDYLHNLTLQVTFSSVGYLTVSSAGYLNFAKGKREKRGVQGVPAYSMMNVVARGPEATV